MIDLADQIINNVNQIHRKRTRTHDGFTEVWCAECNQDWPCHTWLTVDGIVRERQGAGDDQ